MGIRKAQQILGLVFRQRCFYLLIVLLAFNAMVPFIDPGPYGKVLVGGFNCVVIAAAVATVGRTVLSFLIVLLLATAAMLFYWLSIEHHDASHLARAWGFTAALYLATITYLLAYVFRPEVMTADKLCGAAAAYLMIGSLWSTLYGLIDIAYPHSFAGLDVTQGSDLVDFLYFSFTVLTSTGFGDIVPKSRQARAVCNVEQLTGALYIAILIARLAGVYPPLPKNQRRTL